MKRTLARTKTLQIDDYLMQYSDESLFDELRQATDELGRPATYDYFNERDGPSSRTLELRFDSFTRAKRLAGVDDKEKWGKMPVNSDYFSEITTEEQAYWLGVLYGDGSVFKNGCGNYACYLAMIDREHIEKFKNAVNASHPIKENADGTYSIQFTDEKLTDDLRKLGCDENKTDSSTLPDLPESLRPAFVRGLFDADGNFGGKGNWLVITGNSPERFERLLEWVPSDGKVTNYSNTTPRMVINVGDGVHELWEWLYPEGKATAPALERKITKIPTNG